MDFLTLFIVVLLGALFLWRHFTSPHREKRLPPGPRGYPFIGSLFSIDHSHQHLSFIEWGRQYGEIFMYNIGGNSFIVLNSYRAMKEAFIIQGDTFIGRPKVKYLSEALHHDCGISFIDGLHWKVHRRFIIRLLRDFGLGSTVAEKIISSEVEQIKNQLDHFSDVPINCKSLLISSICNIISGVTLSERCGDNEEEFKDLVHHIQMVTSGTDIFSVLPALLPFIMNIPPLMAFIEKPPSFRHSTEVIQHFLRCKIEEHRKHLGDEINQMEISQAKDVCEALLIEKAKEEKENPGNHTFTDWQVIMDITELFVAGSHTTATTLSWGLFYMAVNPKVQEKVHTEIDINIGHNRRPTMKDRRHMNFVNAVIDEVTRCGSVLPLNLHHCATRDTELMEFFIPKDIPIISNLYGIHHDPELWEKPNSFYPEHFLTAEGCYKASEYLNPFSIGKRACPGETLARTEIFLIFVGLMQDYNVKMRDQHQDVKTIEKGISGTVRTPAAHEVIFTRRMEQ